VRANSVARLDARPVAKRLALKHPVACPNKLRNPPVLAGLLTGSDHVDLLAGQNQRRTRSRDKLKALQLLALRLRQHITGPIGRLLRARNRKKTQEKN
jgi:hypothetical protein